MAWTRQQLENLVLSAAQRYGIDPSIAFHQIQTESNFNPTARSSAGAVGIAQFMPLTANDFGLYDRTDPVASMEAWGKYMTLLLNMFGWDYGKALAGYNAGQGRVQSRVRDYGDNWLAHMPQETQNYVSRILSRAGGGGSGDPFDPFDFGTQPADPAMLAAVAVGIIALVWMVAR